MELKGVGSADGKDGGPPATPLPLDRQGSIYSLTFDEFQSTLGGLGKDFGSMNMDELLKNIWTAEEGQLLAAALGGGPAAPGIQRLGSLTLPRTLSLKTVDGVWRDLMGGGVQESAGVSGAGGGAEFQSCRQPTLGEMTLEEFLVKAGVVREDASQSVVPRPAGVENANNSNNNAGSNMFFRSFPESDDNTGVAIGFPQTAAAGPRMYGALLDLRKTVDLGHAQAIRNGGMVEIGDALMNNGVIPGMIGVGGGGIAVGAMGSPVQQADGLGKSNGYLSSVSPAPYSFKGGLRGRKCSGAVEKVVERRQRRMIKNRESAARSRARKQAYSMELEAEVAKLKEQNKELQKKQTEMMEMQKNQVLEMINHHCELKKRCLRRTQTGPW